MLTPAGTAEGLSLNVFADGFTNRGDGLGPIGVGFPSTGGPLVSVEGGSGNPSIVYQFPNYNLGQHTSGATTSTIYAGDNSVGGIASVGSQLYMAQASQNQVIKLNNNGSPGTVVWPAPGNPVALVTDTLTGHLFVSVYLDGIWDFNPGTGTAMELSTQNVDGLTFDPAHNVLYGATADATRVIGLDATTGTQVFDSGFIPGRPDGTALGFGSLAGKLFANTNGGTVVQVDLSTLAQTTIADNGSRGDLVAVDSLGRLYLTQTDSVWRLEGPAGGGFGPQPIPEPSTLTLVGIGLAGLSACVWQQRRKKRLPCLLNAGKL